MSVIFGGTDFTGDDGLVGVSLLDYLSDGNAEQISHHVFDHEAEKYHDSDNDTLR